MSVERLNKEQLALKIAFAALEGSEDPYVKVGSCALRHDNSVAGVGYNGAPPDVSIDWSNREERRKRVIHAEVNALAYTKPGECKLLACTMLPCPNCLNEIARYKIKKVIYCEKYTSKAYGEESETEKLAKEYGIELKQLPKP